MKLSAFPEHPDRISDVYFCPSCGLGYSSVDEERPAGASCHVCCGVGRLAAEAEDTVRAELKRLQSLPITQDVLKELRGMVRRLHNSPLVAEVQCYYFHVFRTLAIWSSDGKPEDAE